MEHSLLDNLTQLGTGGLIALLITREVLGFLKTRKGEDTGHPMSGQLHPDFWKAELRRAVTESMAPLVTAQTSLIAELKQTNNELASLAIKVISGIDELVDMSRRMRGTGA